MLLLAESKDLRSVLAGRERSGSLTVDVIIARTLTPGQRRSMRPAREWDSDDRDVVVLDEEDERSASAAVDGS